MRGILKTKRIYDPCMEEDGFRILADRLWPRGMKKENAHVDVWMKEIAPRNETRKQFHADGDYEAFRKRYVRELEQNENTTALISIVRQRLKEENVTLLTSSKNLKACNISVLYSYLSERI